MNVEDLAIKLQETTDRSLRNEGRIKKLETEQDALRSLATSVAVMANKLDTVNSNLINLSDKVDTLEQKPAKRWDGLVDKIILVIATAVVAYALAKIGL